MFNMTITMFPNAAVLNASFLDLGAGIRSLREPLKEAIQTVMSPSLQENFEVGGRPDWAPLSESREMQKASMGYPPDTLVATGRLEKVVGQMNIWKINGGYGTGEAEAFVSDLPGAEYGYFHESGTYKMPDRPFLLIQPEDEDDIIEVFDNYIDMRLARAGF